MVLENFVFTLRSHIRQRTCSSSPSPSSSSTSLSWSSSFFTDLSEQLEMESESESLSEGLASSSLSPLRFRFLLAYQKRGEPSVSQSVSVALPFISSGVIVKRTFFGKGISSFTASFTDSFFKSSPFPEASRSVPTKSFSSW